MKLFNIILITITVTILNISKIGAQKNTLKVTSVEYINATKHEVMDVLKNYEEFPNWSPFLVSDPNQNYKIDGEKGQIGSTFSWEGVDEKSEGVQTISKIEKNDYILMDCEVSKPFKTHSTFEYTLEEKNGQIIVTQHFQSKMKGFSYFMAKLFGAKKEITEINKLGLSRLKQYIEQK